MTRIHHVGNRGERTAHLSRAYRLDLTPRQIVVGIEEYVSLKVQEPRRNPHYDLNVGFLLFKLIGVKTF